MRHHPSHHALRVLARQLAALIGSGTNSQPVALYRIDPNGRGLIAIGSGIVGACGERNSPHHTEPGCVPHYAPSFRS